MTGDTKNIKEKLMSMGVDLNFDKNFIEQLSRSKQLD